MTTDSPGMCDMMSDMDTSIPEVKHDDSSSSDSTRKEYHHAAKRRKQPDDNGSETVSEKAMKSLIDSIKELKKAVADISVRVSVLEEKQCLCETVKKDILDQVRVEMQEVSKKIIDEIKSNMQPSSERLNLPSKPWAPNPSSSSDTASKPFTSNQSNKSAHGLPSTSSAQSSAANNQQKRHSTIPFIPENCVVLFDVSISEKNSIEKDAIRNYINTTLGPTMVTSINRYHHHTDKPKFMVQMKKRSDAEKLVEKWVVGNVGENVKARLTRPKTHTGMIRDVPITYDDNIFTDEVVNEYPNSKVDRIHKNNRPTRTMKVDFVSESDFKKALEEGILIRHYHTHCVVEKPFSD